MGRILNKFRKGVRFLADRDFRFLVRSDKFQAFDSWPDEVYLKRKYRAALGKELNLEKPRTFNEKLQWLKLYDQRPEYTIMVDKHLVKDYVARQVGEQYIIPTLGVWDDPEKIDFEKLPQRFVLKCNHNSGLGMCICRDKSTLDREKVREGLRRGLEQDYYLTGREWPYKNVSRRIIAEEYLEDGSGSSLTDYKVHNFNGEPKFILVCKDRFSASGVTEDFFDTQWNQLDCKRPDLARSAQPIPRPEELEELLELSRKLSAGIPFLRTDFYIVDHKVYFSELTFSPASGMKEYDPIEWGDVFGAWLTLPAEKRME